MRHVPWARYPHNGTRKGQEGDIFEAAHRASGGVKAWAASFLIFSDRVPFGIFSNPLGRSRGRRRRRHPPYPRSGPAERPPRLPVLTSAFHIEADVRAEIAACLLLTLSRPSGDEVYRHQVYGKPGFCVQAPSTHYRQPESLLLIPFRSFKPTRAAWIFPTPFASLLT